MIINFCYNPGKGLDKLIPNPLFYGTFATENEYESIS
jgi:hypothetical protein